MCFLERKALPLDSNFAEVFSLSVIYLNPDVYLYECYVLFIQMIFPTRQAMDHHLWLRNCRWWDIATPPDKLCRYANSLVHYSDVIMGTMASRITSPTIVYSTVCSCADQRKHQRSASLDFVGNSPRTDEFPTQRASNTENVSIWWRHHGLLVWYQILICSYRIYMLLEQALGFTKLNHDNTVSIQVCSWICMGLLPDT